MELQANQIEKGHSFWNAYIKFTHLTTHSKTPPPPPSILSFKQSHKQQHIFSTAWTWVGCWCVFGVACERCWSLIIEVSKCNLREQIHLRLYNIAVKFHTHGVWFQFLPTRSNTSDHHGNVAPCNALLCVISCAVCDLRLGETGSRDGSSKQIASK